MDPRFARHYSLAEIGPEGQTRLSSATVSVSGDPRAAAVAREYLERAGLTVREGGEPISVERDELAAAWFAGAFAATETIKRVLGVGTPVEIPPYPLAGDDDDER
jgi:hypothetical protein